MRRFVSGLALLLAFLAGTAALTSYVADQLLLDQSRAGELSLDPTERESVAALITTGSASVTALGKDLARRLLLGGVVTLEGSPDDLATDELSHP